MRVIACLVVALAVSACGSSGTPADDETEPPDETPTPWPEDYETWVCGALQELQLNAAPAIDDLVDAAQVFDIDGAAEAAETAADSARAARGMLELAPRWGPGNGLVNDMHRATTLFAQGANLSAAGANASDIAAIEEGNRLIARANRALGHANDKLSRLVRRAGFRCP